MHMPSKNVLRIPTIVSGVPSNTGSRRKPMARRDPRNSTFSTGKLTLGDRHIVEVTGTNAQLSAQFNSPSGVAVDGIGNVYVADTSNDLIRKITPQGVVSTPAGLLYADAGVDGYFTNAQFNFPYGVAVDNAANIYVADTFNHIIRVGRLASVTVPKLAVTLSNHIVTVSWPVPIQNFNLQSSTNLLKTNWTSVATPPAVLNGQNYVTNPAPGGTLFFRLKNP